MTIDRHDAMPADPATFFLDHPTVAPYLKSLQVSGFRGINELRIPRLGRVTLLAGRNGAGKTTVLEAVRAYAARGRESLLSSLLNGRQEIRDTLDDDGVRVVSPNLAALFHGRLAKDNPDIEIGPIDGELLKVQAVTSERDLMAPDAVALPDGSEVLLDADAAEPVWCLLASYYTGSRMMPFFVFSGQEQMSDANLRLYRQYRLQRRTDDLPAPLSCHIIGPDPLATEEMMRYWDSDVVLRDEQRVLDALNSVSREVVERVAARGMHDPRFRRFEVKVAGRREPEPLRSLGDGAVRFFGTAIVLARSRNGLLLIDEAENGIHRSVQAAFWRMVLSTATTNNVQVIATTHSFSCVQGFAEASSELPDADCVLVRLERYGDHTRAVTYEEDQMKVAADHGIEVR